MRKGSFGVTVNAGDSKGFKIYSYEGMNIWREARKWVLGGAHVWRGYALWKSAESICVPAACRIAVT